MEFIVAWGLGQHAFRSMNSHRADIWLAMFLSILPKEICMRASTAIYRSFIKPAIVGGIMCLIAAAAMRLSGLTSVLGWTIRLDWIFYGVFILMQFIPKKAPAEAPIGDSAPKPVPVAGDTRPGVAGTANDRPDLHYIPRQGGFRLMQRGRELQLSDGFFELAKEPFEIIYDGLCKGQAILAMRTQALNVDLESKGLKFLWGISGEGIARQAGALLLSDPSKFSFHEDSASRSRFVAVVSSDCPGLLEQLIQREPHAQAVLSAGRINLVERRVAFSLIAEIPIESCPDQVLHFTHFSYLEGYRCGGNWDQIYRMECGGFPVHLRDHQLGLIVSDPDPAISTVGEGALVRGMQFYDAGEYEKAFEALSEAAAVGDVRAFYRVGEMLHNGLGVAQDYELGRKWLGAAAEAGNLDAMNYVGCAYGQGGNGFPKDDVMSLHYLQAASDGGHAEALANLGNAYYFGEGVPKDVSKAHQLYREAMKRGSPMAEIYLERNT